MKCAAISIGIAIIVFAAVYSILPAEIEFTDSASGQTTVYSETLVRLAPAIAIGILAGIVALLIALRRFHPKSPLQNLGDDPLGLDPGVTPKTIGGGLFQIVARYLTRKP